MTGTGAKTIFDDLDKVLEALSRHVKESTQSIQAPPILRIQPPASREGAGVGLAESVERLKTLSTGLLQASQRLASLSALVERRKSDCEQALAPISCLPDEVLREILAFAILAKSNVHRSAYSACKMSLVCSTWRRIILHYRLMWSDVHLRRGSSVKHFRRRFDLSGQRLRRVTVDDVLPVDALLYRMGGKDWLESAEFLSWSSVRDPAGYLRGRLSAMQLLDDLQLEIPDSCALCKRVEPERSLAFLASETLSQLARLVIRRCDIREVHALTAPRLVSLELSAIICTSSSLNDLLLNLQNLQMLVLNFPRMPLDEQFEWTFVLPSLNYLVSSHVHLPTARVFLQPHRFPALETWVCFYARRQTPDLAAASTILSPLFASFVRSLPNLKGVHFISKLLSHLNAFLDALVPMEVTPSIDPLSPEMAPPAPALRALTIALDPFNLATPADLPDADHRVEQKLLLQRLLQVFSARSRGEMSPLDQLTAQCCSPDEIRDDLQALSNVVPSVVISRCTRAACAPAS